MDDSNSIVKLCIIAAIVVGALVLGFAVLFNSGDNVNQQPVVRQPNPWAEQQKLMRDAMQMAREAQQLNRERMELQRRELEMYEEAYIEASQEEETLGEDW